MITIDRWNRVYFPRRKNWLKLISWLGVALSVSGAFLVANMVLLQGFITFSLGAICWLIVAKIQRNSALFFLESIFLIANINGVLVNI